VACLHLWFKSFGAGGMREAARLRYYMSRAAGEKAKVKRQKAKVIKAAPEAFISRRSTAR
jgi:hypothetical protein